MSSIQLRANISLNDLINSVDQLENKDLEYFLDQILSLHANRKKKGLNTSEGDLLEKINNTLSDEEQETYQKLLKKRDEESLSEEEHSTLLQISDKLELLHAQRMEALSDLAKLKGVKLSALLEQLEIKRF